MGLDCNCCRIPKAHVHLEEVSWLKIYWVNILDISYNYNPKTSFGPCKCPQVERGVIASHWCEVSDES